MGEQLFMFDDIERPTKKVGTAEKYGNYAAFVEKFKGKKTTDDCYTPPAVMDVVNDYVRKLPNVGDRLFVRPFYPGGDYQSFDYPDNCVVVDNPPFSIYSKIVRWYIKQGIDFFLFAPALTQAIINCDVCYLVASANITYENGAVVRTNFTTNLITEDRVVVDGNFGRELERLCKKQTRSVAVYDYDPHMTSIALLLKIANGTDIYRIPKDQCEIKNRFDGMKQTFGNAIILSDAQAQAQARAQAQVQAQARAQAQVQAQARAQAQAQVAIPISLSERERAIIERLNNNSK